MSDASVRPALSVEELTFRYATASILSGLSLDLAPGEVVALLGPSGCGKTTFLKIVAGLLSPTRGRVRIGGQLVADGASGMGLPPERRGVGMVFQDYALWPHMTVAQNVGFPLRMSRVGKAERRRRVEEALAGVGLSGFGARRPSELSGGQQQRVAVARAIVGRPALVLYDEPLSNLDRELRSGLAENIADLMKAEHLSGLYVTHDQSEAFAVADRIVIMSRGAILQQGAPEEIVARPASPEVADFMALGAILPAVRTPEGWRLAQAPVFLCPASEGPNGTDQAQVVLRQTALCVDADSANPNGRVCRKTFTGDGYRLTIKVGQGAEAVELTAHSSEGLAPGTPVGISAEAARLTWFN